LLAWIFGDYIIKRTARTPQRGIFVQQQDLECIIRWK